MTLKEQEAKLKETEDEHSSDLENSLIRLEEEQQRWDFDFFESVSLFSSVVMEICTCSLKLKLITTLLQ